MLKRRILILFICVIRPAIFPSFSYDNRGKSKPEVIKTYLFADAKVIKGNSFVQQPTSMNSDVIRISRGSNIVPFSAASETGNGMGFGSNHFSGNNVDGTTSYSSKGNKGTMGTGGVGNYNNGISSLESGFGNSLVNNNGEILSHNTNNNKNEGMGPFSLGGKNKNGMSSLSNNFNSNTGTGSFGSSSNFGANRPFDSNGLSNNAGPFSSGSGNNGGVGPFSSGQKNNYGNPYSTNGNSNGGMQPLNPGASGSGGIRPFNSPGTSNSGGFNSNSGSISGGMGPFSSGINGKLDGKSPFSIGSNSNNGGMVNPSGNGIGPFSSGGSSNGGGMGSNIENNNNGMGPFASAVGGTSGGGPFNSGNGGSNAGPFSTAGKGNGIGPFSASGGKMSSPFSTAAKGSSNSPFSSAASVSSNNGSPFQISSSSSGGKNPFDTSKFTDGIDFGNLGGAMSTNQAIGNPMDASSLVGASGGPGGMTGSSFSTSYNGGQPGGMAGGMFKVDTDMSGPGGMAGGPFQIDAGNVMGSSTGALSNLNINSVDGGQVDGRFDTSHYEEMLSEMFNPNNFDGELTDKPFDGRGYNIQGHQEIGSEQTTGSKTYGRPQNNQYINSGSYVQMESQNSGHSSAGSLYGGRQTTETGPFDVKPLKESQSPFTVHGNKQQIGSVYLNNAESSLGGANYASVDLSGGNYNSGGRYENSISTSGEYNTGSSYYSGSSGSFTSNSYETPFDKHVDSYNSLISNPFQSQVKPSSQGFSDHYSTSSSSYSPLFSSNQYGGMNPAGNPFQQKGSTMISKINGKRHIGVINANERSERRRYKINRRTE